MESVDKTKENKRPMKGFLKRAWSIVAIIVCALLLLVLTMNFTIIIKSYTNPDKVPDFLGIKPFIVQSGSMEPAILTGDLVIVKTIDPSKLKVNDIISYKEGRSVITHRVVELTGKDGEPAFMTRGDANNVVDQNPVVYAQIEGIYICKINKLGDLAMFMQTPMGMLIFVGIPLCGFVLYDIIRRKLDDKKENSKYGEAQAEIERLKAELEQKLDKEDL